MPPFSGILRPGGGAGKLENRCSQAIGSGAGVNVAFGGMGNAVILILITVRPIGGTLVSGCWPPGCVHRRPVQKKVLFAKQTGVASPAPGQTFSKLAKLCISFLGPTPSNTTSTT